MSYLAVFDLPEGGFWEEERQSGRGLRQDTRLKPNLNSSMSIDNHFNTLPANDDSLWKIGHGQGLQQDKCLKPARIE